jgi:hypothetical protein
MKYDRYELQVGESLMFYEFESDGPKGKVTKLIEYTEMGIQGVYNLGFGDKDFLTGHLNDVVITNNGDGKKVLATVASSVFAFMSKYPDAWIYATGSCKARTRLYRIGISNNLTEIIQRFDVYGLVNNVWYDFERNTEYEAFLVKRKISKFDYENERV